MARPGRARRQGPSAAPARAGPSLATRGLVPQMTRGRGRVTARPSCRDLKRDDGTLAQRRALRAAQAGELDAVLARGLSSLPLDAKQRARAKALAKDAADTSRGRAGRARATGGRGAIDAVAAAIAYAIVYVDHVPLTQAEVAACFRVSVASLAGSLRRASLAPRSAARRRPLRDAATSLKSRGPARPAGIRGVCS